MSAADSEQLIARPKETYDGAIPSGNSVAAMVLQRLAALTGEMAECSGAANGDFGFKLQQCDIVIHKTDGIYGRPAIRCATSARVAYHKKKENKVYHKVSAVYISGQELEE